MPMPRIRLSIRTTLAVIALMAVTMVATISSSRIWGNLYYSAMLAALFASLIGIACGRGERRAYAIGFAIAGWPFFLAHYGPEPLNGAAENLIDRAICDLIYPYMIPAAELQQATAMVPATPAQPTPVSPVSPWPQPLTATNQVFYVNMSSIASASPPAITPTDAWKHWTESNRAMAVPAQYSPGYFRRVLINLFCLGLSLAGGRLAVRLHRAGEAERIAPAVGAISDGSTAS